MTTVEVYYRTDAGDWVTSEHEVRFTRRGSGGWFVVRADNGRHLGWLYSNRSDHPKPVWEARVPSGAFRGETIDDEGNILDAVPTYLTNSDNQMTGFRPVGFGSTREEATSELLYHLHQNHAPALGYGAHPAVRLSPFRNNHHEES